MTHNILKFGAMGLAKKKIIIIIKARQIACIFSVLTINAVTTLVVQIAIFFIYSTYVLKIR